MSQNVSASKLLAKAEAIALVGGRAVLVDLLTKAHANQRRFGSVEKHRYTLADVSEGKILTWKEGEHRKFALVPPGTEADFWRSVSSKPAPSQMQ